MNIIKRIDKLGRIVIPNDIRKRLNIQEDECFEIVVTDENIILKKVTNLKGNAFIDNLCVKFFNLINCNVIVTDLNLVIASNLEIKGKSLSYKYIEFIKGRKSGFYNNIFFKNSNIYFYGYAFPIIKDSVVIGSVFIFNDSKLDDFNIMFGDLILYIIKNNLVF